MRFTKEMWADPAFRERMSHRPRGAGNTKKGSTPWNKGIEWEAMAGKNNPQWKGGRVVSSHGYIRVYSPNHPSRDSQSYVYEHRLVMERVLGRYLLPNER